MDNLRKLATVRKINVIEHIAEADAIEVATVDGWKVVVKKGEFKANDFAVYFEIDSWIPHDLAPFLSHGNEPREFNGVKGERLRTIKLRGQLSQGLLLPLGCVTGVVDEGQDVTELLGVQKWERPINAQLAGVCKGNFPSFLRKTDQERCQNITLQIMDSYKNGELYEVTTKLNGSSMTVYYNNAVGGVCSRNLDLKLDQEGNAFVDTAKRLNILNGLISYGRNIALQGELCGVGIQGNPEGLSECKFFLFDIFDIDAQRYMTPLEREEVFKELIERYSVKINHVPKQSLNQPLTSGDIAELLKLAEGKNTNNREIEGLVFKRMDGKFSFKVISNRFLLKGGE